MVAIKQHNHWLGGCFMPSPHFSCKIKLDFSSAVGHHPPIVQGNRAENISLSFLRFVRNDTPKSHSLVPPAPTLNLQVCFFFHHFQLGRDQSRWAGGPGWLDENKKQSFTSDTWDHPWTGTRMTACYHRTLKSSSGLCDGKLKCLFDSWATPSTGERWDVWMKGSGNTE